MNSNHRPCPDCQAEAAGLSRRDFLKTTGAAGVAAIATTSLPVWAQAKDTSAASQPESLVKVLYDTLTDAQKPDVCYAWDYIDSERGLLRTRVANNWHVNQHEINSDFYSDEQRAIIREIFEGIIHPDWHARIEKQLEDDAGGYGEQQNIAIFGQPGDGKFQFLMTGRHMTLRCDGDSADHVAFGGPIFYGHAADGFNEKPDHPGNVFWPQAVEANKVYAMLDGKQRQSALVKVLPPESSVAFRGPGAELPGIRVTELSPDQREQLQKTLQALLEPYRQSDRDEVVSCLKTQGGLDACSLAFFQEGNLGDDEVWDCWRLEGPSFVWHFRGSPHVHVWVNVADSHKVELNA